MTISATTQGLRMGVATSSSRPTVPFDGQVISETDTDSLSVYKGSAWAPVSGLTLITAQTVGTAVASVTVSSAFSATYDNYKITYTGGTGGVGAIYMKLGATATGYYAQLMYQTYNTSGFNGVVEANAAQWSFIGMSGTAAATLNADLINPFLTMNTSYSSVRADSTTSGSAGTSTGYLNNSTSYTAFTLTPQTGTLTGGTIRVYGYANS